MGCIVATRSFSGWDISAGCALPSGPPGRGVTGGEATSLTSVAMCLLSQLHPQRSLGRTAGSRLRIVS